MRRFHLLLFCLLAGVLLVLRLIPLEQTESVSLCIFYHLTGRRCPGCGMTRAFANWVRGDWQSALAWNPLSAPLFLAWVGLMLDELYTAICPLLGKTRFSVIERLFFGKKR